MRIRTCINVCMRVCVDGCVGVRECACYVCTLFMYVCEGVGFSSPPFCGGRVSRSSRTTGR